MKTMKLSSVFAIVFTVMTMAIFMSCEKEVTPPKALTVTSVSVPNNAVDVEVNTLITITCDRNIDPATVNPNSVKVIDKNNNPVITNYDCSGKVITIKPPKDYANGMTYNVSIANVKAEDGGILEAYSFSFTTKKAPFTPTSITPANDATNVDLNAEIKISFNRDIDQSSVSTNSIKVTDQNNKSVSVTFTCVGSNITVKPSSLLNEGVKYTVTISGVKSKDGIEAGILFSFTTKSSPFSVVEVKSHSDLSLADLNAEMIIVFNKDIDASTVSANNIKAVDQNNKPASIKFSCDGKNISIKPETEYTSGMKYTVTLSGVKSVSGITMNTYNFSFTTKKTPFNVVSTTLLDGAQNVETNTEIKIVFNKDVDKSTTTASVIKIVDQNNNAASLVLVNDGKNLTIRPSVAYVEGMKYTLSIVGLKSVDGVVMDSFTLTFTTKQIPLSVVSISPGSNATNVELNAEIKISLNKDIDKNSATTSSIKVLDKDGKQISVSIAVDGKNLTIHPSQILAEWSNYTVLINGLKSVDGAVLNNYSSFFATKQSPLSVVSITPNNGSTGVELNSDINVAFNKNVDMTTTNQSNIKLSDQSGNEVSISISSNGKTVTIRPLASYAFMTKYTVSINGVKSSEGVDMIPFTSTFTTKNGSIFSVISTTPADKAANVDKNAQVKILFNKEVDRSTLENGIKLFLANSNQMAIDFTVSGNEVTFAKRGDYSPGSIYVVKIEGLKAIDGTTITPASFTFKIKEAPLTVYSTTPTNGATNVALNANIIIEFSKLLNIGNLKGSDVINMAPLNPNVSGVTYYCDFDNSRTFTIRPSDLKPNETYIVYTVSDVTSADGDKIALHTELLRFTTGSK